MNREEIKNKIWNIPLPEVHSIVDKIFDHFEAKEFEVRQEAQKQISTARQELESRTCENCEYWSVEFQALGLCEKGIKEESQFKEPFTYSTFGCNKFKRKV